MVGVDISKLEQAKKFGRVDDDGNVFVKLPEGEVRVGQYSTGEIDREMSLFTRRFVDAEDKLNLFSARIHAQNNITTPIMDEALVGFKKFLEFKNAVGDYADLTKKVEAIEPEIVERKAQNKQHREEVTSLAMQTLRNLTVQLEELANRPDNKIVWKDVTGVLDTTFANWQDARKGKHLPEGEVNELWTRFSSSRTSLLQRKKAFFDDLRKNFSLVKQRKDGIIQEAEAAKETNNFDAGKRTFSRLMASWKEIGRGDRKVDDSQWKKFNDARDHFFSRLPKDEKPMQKTERVKWDNDTTELRSDIGGLDVLEQLRQELLSAEGKSSKK